MLKVILVLLFFYCFSAFAVDYKYDSTKRITEATYKDGTVVSYAYDQNGNLLSMTPSESPSDGGDSDGGTDGDNTDNQIPDTAEPAKKESGGGTFGWLTLLLATGIIALRSGFKTKLKS
ncbi:RHS repeat domain-containing protein [Pseudoalteromonas sp. ASV78]|uniref:RHS repeat domain-containing protein n=1 Tax=Pseudoalteromonas sp. ASV78 TaxID=3397851 RepID=UPI0039FD82B6